MKKSADAFRTISEVADWLDTPTHVLRFWESKFTQIKPVKRAGGRRYYRPKDMLLIGGIKKLLHKDGLTIKRAKQVLNHHGEKYVCSLSQPLLSDIAQKPESDKKHITNAEAPKAKSKAEWKPVALETLAASSQIPPKTDYAEVKYETQSNPSKEKFASEENALTIEENKSTQSGGLDLKIHAKESYKKKVSDKFLPSVDERQATFELWNEDEADVSKKTQGITRDERKIHPKVTVAATLGSILEHLATLNNLNERQVRSLSSMLSKLEETMHNRQRRSKR